MDWLVGVVYNIVVGKQLSITSSFLSQTPECQVIAKYLPSEHSVYARCPGQCLAHGFCLINSEEKKVINAIDIYKNLEGNFAFVNMVVLLNYLFGIVP